LDVDLTATPAPPTAHAAAATGTESVFAQVLADVLHVERVPVDGHFFDDLGADSMVMAQFCARVRKHPGAPAVSIKDVYQHPTVRGLAAALTETAPTSVDSPVPSRPEVATRASTVEYVVCGTLQFLFFLGYTYVAGRVAVLGYDWISGASGLVDTYLRSVIFGGAAFVGMCTLPILAKWLLVGRWTRQQIRIWSLAYVRFWVVKALVQRNPVVLLFLGTPLYSLYLRALGAKVGRRVAIFSVHVPVCTDLLTIGDDTVIRKDSFFTCYRAHAGVIQTGAVTLGTNVLVSETTVLDIETSLGDGAQLDHASSLHAGQAVPAGQRWHGSPAQRTEADYQAVDPAECGTLRRTFYTVFELLKVLALYVPLAIGGVALLFAALPQLARLDSAGTPFSSWTFYRDALATSFVVFFGGSLVLLLVTFTVPRVLNLALEPGKVYPLYGFHYGVHRTIERMSNNKFFTGIFGDSSYIVHYLRCLGYKLSPLVQTGSNFGTDVKHENPFLVSVGTATVCASELSIDNVDYSSTSFRVSRARIGANNYLGNMILYPSRSRVGDNCLLATKVLVPIDGKVREGVGLLGSPSFEIPRSVHRDTRFDHLTVGEERQRRLAAKNRHNLVTIGLFLLVAWLFVSALMVIFSGIVDLHAFGPWEAALPPVLILPFTILYAVLVERAAAGFRPLQPTYCSIYDIGFWRRERFLKHVENTQMVLNGTPFKSVVLRLLGVRVGRRLFDDGVGMAEKNLVSIGDDVTLNVGSNLQCHSQEDYVFKSDRIAIGSGCTVGVGTMVFYGATMGDGSVLAPDSFLMKGEEVPPGARWGGNPAREMPDAAVRRGVGRPGADGVGRVLAGAK
jgi:non-ribosomal peptide synthetase-like protein